MMITNPRWKKTKDRLSLLVALVAFTLLGSACGVSNSGDAETGTPVAEFSQDRTAGGPGLMVQFSDDSSGNLDAWDWDFGAAGTSNEQNPLVQFDAVGLYTVELVVTGPEGRSTITKPGLIEVSDAETANVANFTSTRRMGGPGMTVTFSNTSLGDLTSTEWTFTRDAGEMTELVIQRSDSDPVVVFDELGRYDVLLEVEGSAGDGVREIEEYVIVTAPDESGVADFTADRTTGGPGMTVNFENASAGSATSFEWDFGAAGMSNDEDPVVVFDAAGTYTVRLSIAGNLGESTKEVVDFITVVDAAEAGIADFDASDTSVGVGEAVQFTDRSALAATTHSWTFTRDPGGVNELVLNSSDANPSITFTQAGTYDVSLTVTGAGGQSTLVKEDFIRVFGAPTTSFTCTPNTTIFIPATRTCTETSTDAVAWHWTFADDGNPTAFECFVTEDSSFEVPEGVAACASATPTYTWTTTGDFGVTVEAIGPGGSDTQTQTFSAVELEIRTDPDSGTAAVSEPVIFRARRKGVPVNFFFWEIDQLDLNGQNRANPLFYTFKTPGTYTVKLLVQNGSGGVLITRAETEIQYTVNHAPPTADFTSENTAGSGPLEVVFSDESTGVLTTWLWAFGDGARCFFSEDSQIDPPEDVEDCGSSSPTHEYTAVGPFNVTLTVAGPENEGDQELIESVLTKENEVHVSIVDPSFELQTSDAQIAGNWVHLRPVDATEVATHVALDEASGGSDIGMPSDGTKWAALDGLGTSGVDYSGIDEIDEIENGIQQEFFFPEGQPVLEFDYTFLYNEPPAAMQMPFDAVAATVTDGTTVVVIESSKANTRTPYAGQSLRFPTRDGRTVRSTPRHTASLNIQDAFPGSDRLTPFTLTIRTTNAKHGLRSPRAFVDNIRFSEPAGALTAEFTLDTLAIDPEFADLDVVFANSPAEFRDTTCPAPDACDVPTSWRWDFGTHDSLSPPAASGSGDQNPSYVFEEPSDDFPYVVELVVRRGDVESVAIRTVTVIEKPQADFELDTVGPLIAPATLEFSDTSTANALDPILRWSWDFNSFASSDLQSPGPVDFLSTGQHTVTLTIETESGATDTATLDVTITLN